MPPITAREMKEGEAPSYRPWQTILSYRNDPVVKSRREKAWAVARAAAALLKGRFGVERVVAFGSIVRKSGFTPWSDVDLAVWGLDSENFLTAAGETMDLGLDEAINVDVVAMERCAPALRDAVDREGVEL